jgi:hypothetical protein
MRKLDMLLIHLTIAIKYYDSRPSEGFCIRLDRANLSRCRASVAVSRGSCLVGVVTNSV